MGAGHVQIAAADVAGVLEVRGGADHAPVYPEALRPLALFVTRRARALLRQATREPLHPHLATARHF